MELKPRESTRKSSGLYPSSSSMFPEDLEQFIFDLREWVGTNFTLTERKSHSPCPYPPETLRSKSLHKALLSFRTCLVSTRSQCFQAFSTLSQDLERAEHSKNKGLASVQQELASLKESVNSPLRASYSYLLDELAEVKSAASALAEEVAYSKIIAKDLLLAYHPNEPPSAEASLSELMRVLNAVLTESKLKPARHSLPLIKPQLDCSPLRKLEQMNKSVSRLIHTLR